MSVRSAAAVVCESPGEGPPLRSVVLLLWVCLFREGADDGEREGSLRPRFASRFKANHAHGKLGVQRGGRRVLPQETIFDLLPGSKVLRIFYDSGVGRRNAMTE